MLPTSVALLGSALFCGALIGFGCQPANNNLEDQAATEQLWLTPPKGWKLASSEVTKTEDNGTAVRHVRYVDPNEVTHSLTIESRNNSTLGLPAADPLDMLEQLAANEQQDCHAAGDFNTFTGIEHGFGTAVRLFICEPTELATGRLTLLKIIQGQQQTYLVALQHQWSNAPSTTSQKSLGLDQNNNNIFDRVAVWSLYMRGVRVCAASGCPQHDN